MAQTNEFGAFDKLKNPRRQKSDLESRSFKDGKIYLFRRNDYKKPTWFCRVKVPGSKGYVSCSTKTTDEHEAFKFADDLYNKSLVRVIQGQDLKGMRVSSAITSYVDDQRANAALDGWAMRRCKFLEKVKPFFGTMKLSEITAATLLDMASWMQKGSKKEQLSPNTVKRYTTDVKTFLKWSVDKDYVVKVPSFPKIKMADHRRPDFDHRDYAKLTRYLREFVKHENAAIRRDRTMLTNYVLILANTGIRIGEARTLKWRDIREIPPSNGSSEKPNIALSVKGKTGPRVVVARTPDVKDYLKRILELRIDEMGGKKPSTDEYVFCNKDGVAIGSFKKSFISLVKAAGVEFNSHGERRTIYSLRHTYATFRLQEGVQQYALAKNMGTSVAMLERHYGHTTNVNSADELTKTGKFTGNRRVKKVDWLLE
jgi:integrase